MKPHSVISRNVAKKFVHDLRRKGKKVIFTNGFFDIIHVGHVKFLEKAKSLGDVLMVGINSDKSIKLIKGKRRPLMSQQERAKLVSSLNCVDYVILFDEKLPSKILSELKPDIHVKGADYTIKKLPERKVINSYGGKIMLLPLIKGKSTTNIINKIVRVYGKNGAKKI